MSSKVAIIGLGNIGGAVAANLVKGNRDVIVADRKIEKAKSIAVKLGEHAQPAEIPAAIKDADIIILAIYFDPIRQFLKQYANELQGKIIIDPSNPIALAENGGFKKTIGDNESAGQIISTELPAGARLVKAFGSLGVDTLLNAAHKGTDQSVMFYATDDTGLTSEIEELIHNSGFEPLRVGGIEKSIRIEVFGDLNEYGALGKTVTLAEAKEKL